MTSHAITVLGNDRPGIIAYTTRILAELGLNIEDSTMTILRGHFAMTLICEGTASAAVIEDRLSPLEADGALTVTVREVLPDAERDLSGTPYVLTVHGGDRPGIVSAMTAEVARAGGNITDLTTRLAGGLYLVVAEVDLPLDADADKLEQAVREAATRLGVQVTLRPGDSDEL